MDQSWSALLPEILDVIMRKLSLPDCFNFHKVCRTWRSVFLEGCRLTRPPPYMVQSRLGMESRLWSLHGDQLTKLHSPMLKLRKSERIAGSSDGWLVIVRDYYLSHLLNPISNEHIPLPWFDCGCIYHVVLSTNPKSPNCVLVVSGSNHHESPIYAWCKLSNSEWTFMNVDLVPQFELGHINFHQGKLYVLKGNGNIQVFSFDPWPKITFKGSIANIGKGSPWSMQRMVQSGDDLFLIGWRRRLDKNEISVADIDSDDEFVKLDVFKQGETPDEWARVESLGGRMLLANNYVGGSIESCSNQELLGSGFEPNCIYYVNNGDKDLVKFSVINRSSQRICIPKIPEKFYYFNYWWIVTHLEFLVLHRTE